MVNSLKLRSLVQSLAVVTAALLITSGVQAIGPQASVQPVSLEVKQRIQAIEQINVTAEKPIDESAPQASLEVEALLAELAELEQADAAE